MTCQVHVILFIWNTMKIYVKKIKQICKSDNKPGIKLYELCRRDKTKNADDVCECQFLVWLHLRSFQQVFMFEFPLGGVLSEKLLLPFQKGWLGLGEGKSMSLFDGLDLSQGIGLNGAIVAVLLEVLIAGLGGPLCIITPLVEHVLHVLVKLWHLSVASDLVDCGKMSTHLAQAGKSLSHVDHLCCKLTTQSVKLHW